MKIICILMTCMILLSGCSLIARQEQPQKVHSSFAGTGNMNVNVSGNHYVSQGGMLSGGVIEDKPVDDTGKEDEKDDQTEPPVTNQPEVDSELVGKWEYVDALEDVYILTLLEQGGAELELYFRDESDQLSRVYSMSFRPEIEDGRITIPGDTEYDPPSLVLQLEYVEGVGNILDVVSSAGSLSDLTEYFHRIG